MPKISQICANCGEEFWEYESNHRKYCSEKCSRLASRTARPSCKVCGKPVRLMRNIYCSKSCSNIGKPKGCAIPSEITSYAGLYWKLQKMYPTPEPCQLCGADGQHRHHPDYDKPYEIVWLCESCHHKLHPRNRKVRTKKIRLHTESFTGRAE